MPTSVHPQSTDRLSSANCRALKPFGHEGQAATPGGRAPSKGMRYNDPRSARNVINEELFPATYPPMGLQWIEQQCWLWQVSQCNSWSDRAVTIVVVIDSRRFGRAVTECHFNPRPSTASHGVTVDGTVTVTTISISTMQM